jgi:hypothetical protein
MSIYFSADSSLGQSPNTVDRFGKDQKKKKTVSGSVVCITCTFVYPEYKPMCGMCSAHNPLVNDEELARAIAEVDRIDFQEHKDREKKNNEDNQMCGVFSAHNPLVNDEELARAIAEVERMDLQEHEDREKKNNEDSMRLILRLNGDRPSEELLCVKCSVCSLDNNPDRVQCIVCGTELDKKERDLAPDVVSREQITLGLREYDTGGAPDVNMLNPLGFRGKTGNACLVNATAFVVKEACLLHMDLAILSDRITKDCTANPGTPMWSDLLGVWFQGLNIKINILYGPVNPEDKFQDWASLRKFNPRLRTLIIGNTGSHYAVYSPLQHPLYT